MIAGPSTYIVKYRTSKDPVPSNACCNDLSGRNLLPVFYEKRAAQGAGFSAGSYLQKYCLTMIVTCMGYDGGFWITQGCKTDDLYWSGIPVMASLLLMMVAILWQLDMHYGRVFITTICSRTLPACMSDLTISFHNIIFTFTKTGPYWKSLCFCKYDLYYTCRAIAYKQIFTEETDYERHGETNHWDEK